MGVGAVGVEGGACLLNQCWCEFSVVSKEAVAQLSCAIKCNQFSKDSRRPGRSGLRIYCCLPFLLPHILVRLSTSSLFLRAPLNFQSSGRGRLYRVELCACYDGPHWLHGPQDGLDTARAVPFDEGEALLSGTLRGRCHRVSCTARCEPLSYLSFHCL